MRAADPASAPADLLLSMAAEFRPVDPGLVERRLDQLADRVKRARCHTDWQAPATERDLLLATVGFKSARRNTPEAFMLDTVLARGEGHPLLIAAVAQEAARRAGLPLAILGGEEVWVVGDIRFEPAVLVDPARGAAWPAPGSPPKAVRPRCPHEIAFAVLVSLTCAYGLRGDVARAIEATNLRLALPIAEPVRRAVELERQRLEARLN